MQKRAILILLAPISALLVGALVMHEYGVNPILYGLNILCYAVLGLLLFFLRNWKGRLLHSVSAAIAVLVLDCALLAFTFLDSGLDGVHRWVAIGSFRFYISSIILPGVIFSLSMLWQREISIASVAVPFVIVAMLLLQPDASQLSAFAVSAGYLVFTLAKNKVAKYTLPLALVGCIVYAWMHIDGLEAVPHVEGILMLAGEVWIGYYVLGLSSLVLLISPFLCPSSVSTSAKAIGIYYLVVIVSTFLGNFPIPFMGYGISPIAGYMLAAFLLNHETPLPSGKGVKEKISLSGEQR